MEAARAWPAAPLRLVRDEASELTYDALIERAGQAERRAERAEARGLYETALARVSEARGGLEASNVLRWIARTYFADGDLDLALEYGETALAVAQAHGDLGAAGQATNTLAGIRRQQGDLDEAKRLYDDARATALLAGDARLAAMTAQNLGVIANIRGELGTALHHYEAGLAAYRQLGMPREVCIALNNLGLLHTQCERWTEAAGAYEESLRIAELQGDLQTQLHVEVNRAHWSVAQGDHAAARVACQRALALSERVHDPAANGELHKAFGIVERHAGDFHNAERHLALAHELATTRQDMLLLADVTRELAELHRLQGRNRDALQCLNRAHRLYAQLRARRELAEVDRRLEGLESDFLDVVRRWGESIECNDEYTQGHCERVANIACALAARDGMDQQSLFWFRIGALLHDVGKLVIPPAVLNKHGQLTDEEWALMRSHPTAGVAMLAEVEFPWDVGPIVEGHHERWDGTGYPHALAGEAIPRVARMVCIADVYDALTSERSYKRGMSHTTALEVMRADVGRQFDPALFALFEVVAAERAGEWAAPVRDVIPRAALQPPTSGGENDDLTGLPLRRAFNEAARSALAAGSGRPVSLLIIDVDHFKLINDTFGHLQGDAVLREVATALRIGAPSGAFVARFAGDEFVILLPDAPLDLAVEAAERLRLAVHGVPVATRGAMPIALTVSIGVSSAAAGTRSVEALFTAADTALYEAKRAGRDAVASGTARAREAPPRLQLDAFLGRDAERGRMVSLFADAVRGAPRVLSVVGEAGVGKSALVRALGNDARMAGGSLVAGKCADSSARAPYWPWASVMSAIRALRIVPDRPWNAMTRLLPGVEGQTVQGAYDDRLAMFEEVSDFLRLATTSRPLVVLLDDMQWADDASWDLLEYVVARLDRERLLLCLTVREEDAGPDVLVRRSRLSRDERFGEIAVQRLREPELAQWLHRVVKTTMPAALVAHLYQRSEGVPFFAVQVVSAMIEDGALHWTGDGWHWDGRLSTGIPTAVRDLLGRRLAKLSPAAARVLGAAAVIGRAIDLDALIAVGIAPENALLDAMDEGTNARVIVRGTHDTDDRASFTHGLLVELLEEAMHPRRARRLREQAAQSPPARRGTPPSPARVTSAAAPQGAPDSAEAACR